MYLFSNSIQFYSILSAALRATNTFWVRCNVMWSCDVIMWCDHVMWSCDVIMWCYHVMWSCDVIMWCDHVMWSCDVIMWCNHVTIGLSLAVYPCIRVRGQECLPTVVIASNVTVSRPSRKLCATHTTRRCIATRVTSTCRSSSQPTSSTSALACPPRRVSYWPSTPFHHSSPWRWRTSKLSSRRNTALSTAVVMRSKRRRNPHRVPLRAPPVSHRRWRQWCHRACGAAWIKSSSRRRRCWPWQSSSPGICGAPMSRRWWRNTSFICSLRCCASCIVARLEYRPYCRHSLHS